MGIDPYLFNQVGEGFPPSNSQNTCSSVFFQHGWQGGGSYLSREEIARTMARAEFAIAQELGYWPAPKHVTGEQVDNHGKGLGYSAYYDWTSQKLRWKKLRASGIETRDVIALGSQVVYLDQDGDGVDDQFAVSIVGTTLTSPDDIRIYFSSADRNGAPIDESWRIHPVSVIFAGGNAAVMGHPSLMVKPDLTTTYAAEVLDVTDLNNFVQTVDVYHYYTDDTATLALPNQGLAIFDNPGCLPEPCAATYTPICMAHLNSDAGVAMFRYADGCVIDRPFAAADRFQVNYSSGARLVDGNVDPEMADIVSHLTTAWLPTSSCGCDSVERIIEYWRDVPRAGPVKTGTIHMSFNKMDYPFGNERGAIYAYERLQMLRATGAVSV
jgi:phage baseplate assembly protein gpV